MTIQLLVNLFLSYSQSPKIPHYEMCPLFSRSKNSSAVTVMFYSKLLGGVK